MINLDSRLMLSHACTVIAQPDVVLLVAGEDLRYALRGEKIERWAPKLLAELKEARSLDELLGAFKGNERAEARQLIERLYGERAVVDAPAEKSAKTSRYHIALLGKGELFTSLQSKLSRQNSATTQALNVFCQDTLNFEEALQFNRCAISAGTPWMWLSSGAVMRAFISPLFIPPAGPCFECLLSTFSRLSPAREVYQALARHAAEDGAFEPATLSLHMVEVVSNLLLWKISVAAEEPQIPALFRLHVIERDSLETSSHKIYCDPLCAACRR